MTVKLTEVKLSEICEIKKGTFSATKTPIGKYPLVVTAAARKSSDSYQIDKPSICIPLISSTGHGHASIKRIHYQEGKFALASILAAIIPKNNSCFPKFLYHLLDFKKEEYFVKKMRGSANVSLKISKIGETTISLPPLDLQKKIANLLDTIQETKIKKDIFDVKFSSLLQSSFGRIFGNLVPADKDWKKMKLENICNLITDGTHYTPKYENNGVMFLSVKNVLHDKIITKETKFISKLEHQTLTKYKKPENLDILYTKVGSYGRAAVINDLPEFSIFVSLALLKPKHDLVNPYFLCSLLNSPFIKKQADRRIKGIGVPDLHLQEIRNFDIYLPPLSVQNKYELFYKKIIAFSSKPNLVDYNKFLQSVRFKIFKELHM